MKAMRRFRTVLAVPVLVLAACGGDDDAAPPPTPSSVATSVKGTVAPTTQPPATALVPGTEGGDPLYPEPTSPTTEPVVTVPTPTATTTPATSSVPESAPPTTESVAAQALVLSGDGVGLAKLGTDPESVVQYVSSILGGSTADSGWVDPDTFGFCPGNTMRRVDWGVLSLMFSDGSELAVGRNHFVGWEYGRLGQVGDEPVGLRTAGGVTLGSPVVDVLGEFPDASLIAGDPDLDQPDQVYVDDSFVAYVSGLTDTDTVTVLFGGARCG